MIMSHEQEEEFKKKKIPVHKQEQYRCIHGKVRPQVEQRTHQKFSNMENPGYRKHNQKCKLVVQFAPVCTPITLTKQINQIV